MSFAQSDAGNCFVMLTAFAAAPQTNEAITVITANALRFVIVCLLAARLVVAAENRYTDGRDGREEACCLWGTMTQ